MSIRLPWHVLGLLAVFAAAVVAAVLELGPPSSSSRTSTEVVTAAKGIVQSTVTGTGNVEPGTDVEVNFQTSGTLQKLYVKDGDHVLKGQLIATLDPTAAQLTVEQAQSSLTSAQDNLTNAENQTVTSSSGSSSSASTSVGDTRESTEFVTFHPAATTQTSTTPNTTSTTPVTTTQSATTPTRSTPTRTTPTRTTTTQTTPTQTTSGGTRSGGSSSRSGGSSSGSAGSGGSSSGGSGSGQTSTTSAETIAANIASAQAAVDGAEATLRNAENALSETRLYAPATGTVVNVESVAPGDTISGGAGSNSSSSSNSNSNASSNSSTGSTAGSLTGSNSSSSSSSSGLVEIVNTGSMTMTVAFSESDVSKIKVGQPANITLEALSGVELAAHVSSISTLGSSSSGVVSYDATLTLDQRDSRVKPGMSASAAVITGQASGVNLPNSAVTTTGSVARVDLLQNGKVVPTTVVVGLVGDSRTQIVSGLKAGAQIQVTTTLPSLGSGSSLSSGSSGTLGSGGLGGGAARFLGGGGGFAGGAGGFAGGGGGRFRGGG